MDSTQNTVIEQQPKHIYTLTDTVIAFISLFFGYALHKLVFSYASGIGAFIICALAVAIILFSFAKSKIKLTKPGMFYIVSAVAFSLAPFFTGSELLCALTFMYACAAITLGALTLGGNSIEPLAGDRSLFDLLKAVFLMPFARFGSLFGALGGNGKKGHGRRIALIFCGVLIAVIPTFIIIQLLSSADGIFENLMDKFYELFAQEALTQILIFLFCVPISMYFFGMIYANKTHACENSLTAEQCSSSASAARFCNMTVACAALTPILIVYVIYFVLQFGYFTSAFSNLLPDGFSYADYARRGFFELCGVTCINALMLICANAFTKRTEGKNRLLKAYSVIISVFTLVLISTAIAKMLMYIGEYGLTPLRVYTTLFMALLFTWFVFALIRFACKKFNLVRSCLISFTVVFAIVCFSGVNARIAQYNVWLYTSGRTESIDLDIMPSLGSGALEYVLPLVNDEDENVRKSARWYVINMKRDALSREDSFTSFNLADSKADALLSQLEITAENADKTGIDEDITLPK